MKDYFFFNVVKGEEIMVERRILDMDLVNKYLGESKQGAYNKETD